MPETKSIQERIFYSRGKLLLTGEYAVLRGARALALPSRLGQYMEVIEGNGPGVLSWESTSPSGKWFEARFRLPEIDVVSSTDQSKAGVLRELILTARQLRSGFLEKEKALQVTSTLEFLPGWGLGSSSSLVSNMADWAKCDPFELNRRVFHSSGYDVACARSNGPILYRRVNELPEIIAAKFRPSFADNLWLVYLNEKKNSQNAVKAFAGQNVKEEIFVRISALSEEVVLADGLDTFCNLLNEHEKLVGGMTGLIPVKEKLFPEFDGCIKSLGAWGGDFVLAATKQPEKEVRKWFGERGYETVLPFNEIILND
ncbi:GYDIA family GHMP kinase [Prolixibacter sp. SD074]|uniref:GYDIA family GHMP kinase n=1 Tax=Prolixibacter sp. SD074 TaxID=2652391 RepID=UPI00129944BE|nr:GYDIA family GHMP kinase [Prolixibacter sp. SD074]